MSRKKVSIIVAIVAIIAFLLSYIISYANTGETIYVNLTPTDLTGVGYGLSDPTNAGSGNYIWYLKTYNTNNVNDISTSQRNLYCIKANYGDEWNVNENTIVPYNLSYDLQADRENLLRLLGNSITANNVVKKLLDPTENVGYYRELLWILDNFYIEGKTDKTAFLANAGINTEYYDYVITDSDIKAVQRAAIWYYTNFKTDGDSEFDQLSATGDWLTITSDGEDYEYLSDLTRLTEPRTAEGEERNEQAVILYEYLVNQASANAYKYTSENNYTIKNGASVNTDGLQQLNGRYMLSTKRVDSNYIIGPIVIDKNGNLPYTIQIQVTDEHGTDINYQFTDSNGTSLGNATINDLVGRTEGFYISVTRNSVEEIDVNINIKQETTNKTLWLTGEETTDSITLDAEQPIVEVVKVTETIPTKFKAIPSEFDLALRKNIIAVNGINVTNTRVPNISESTLQSGTTATYRHRKEPLVVKENDTVTYKLTIYNEGNKAGYATQIIDQLPTGLISSTENPTTIISKGKDGKDKNSYTLTYNTTTNKMTLDIIQETAKSLDSYTTTKGLDYEEITIKCKVIEEADTKVQKVLTNVAWISGAYDSETGKVAVDRDSQPETAPNVNKSNMATYKGNTNNKDDLTDSNYFYEGEQDDDDFEKLVIMPEEKIFDLALFKHIAAISKDQTIENGEYVTDNKNIDGTYLRAPIVTVIDPDTGKITYQQDNKDALIVEPGDYVLYTIRVYNEGEVDGYATEIKDTLPIGLEFVVSNTEYNGIWKLENLDADGRQVVTTTWYAKGQGAELNSVQGDENYTANLLRALNPEGAISKENPDYIDAQVLCRVVEQATSDRVLVNYAQISEDSDKNGNEIDDVDSTPDEWIDGEDDQDIERIKLQFFDLSLRKFVTQINDIELKNADGTYTREPVVDVTPLKEKTGTTAIYNHPKTPVPLQIGDRVIYTIRVYNEGDINGYASKVIDYLPTYLTYISDSEMNQQYGWQVSSDGRIVTTTYLANKELTGFIGTELDYEDVQIECLVSETTPVKLNLTNIAEISEYTYNGSVTPNDIDSSSNNMESNIPGDDTLPNYKQEQENNEYVPGFEDDDDFEKVYVREFDLALRKFITQIQDKEITTRIPQVKFENGRISYEHPKDALYVHVNDRVIYTLRIYNEGEINGYASEITDDIPEYLEYLPEDSTNVEYMWKMYDENGNETENASEAVKIKTTYLSKENSEENLLKAFDETTLSYKDIKIAFKVKDPSSNTYIITNHAQISNDTDENGNPIKDKDSITDEWNEGEDDQDIENVKVEYFDLSILKFVSKVIVIEDGKENVTETGYNGHENPEPVVKVELHRKKLDKVTVKFGYGITITNEGDIAGYASEITDYVPQGLKFDATDNPNWTDEGNNVISTKQLEDRLLQPGESVTIEVILTWINGKDNLALKTNTVEISEDNNEHDVPDKDSTPDNKVDGEDDIDIAQVILTVATGKTKTYFLLTLGLLTTVLVGIVLIKRFVI